MVQHLSCFCGPSFGSQFITAFVVKIAFALASFAGASAEPSATLALERRSFLHTSHSKRRIAFGAAFSLSNFWHPAWLRSSLCPFQLPGTGVAKPCQNAWFASVLHFVLYNFVYSATKYPGCARTRPVLSRHGFRPGPCPRSTLARGWYGLLSSFCIAPTIPTGHLPKKFHMAVAAATYHLPE